MRVMGAEIWVWKEGNDPTGKSIRIDQEQMKKVK